MWKQLAFLELINNPLLNFDSQLITNLIVIGDSPYEVAAGKLLAKSLTRSLIKIIQFIEKPTIKDMIKQMKIANNKFNEVVHTFKNVTINL